MDAILLTGCPALLESRGPGHRPPIVYDWGDGYWSETSTSDPPAVPLWWHGSPVWPAIDAAVRLANDAWNERDGRHLVHPRPCNTTRENILALAEDIAEILSATLINLEPPNAPNV